MHIKLLFTKLLSVAVLVLAISVFALYRQKVLYQNQNTKLILVNDSVMSANIELTKLLNVKDSSSSNVLPTSKKKK